jgi:hypothetical protein
MCSEKSERFGMRHATDECLIENFSELAPQKTFTRDIKRQNVAFLKTDRDPVKRMSRRPACYLVRKEVGILKTDHSSLFGITFFPDSKDMNV